MVSCTSDVYLDLKADVPARCVCNGPSFLIAQFARSKHEFGSGLLTIQGDCHAHRSAHLDRTWQQRIRQYMYVPWLNKYVNQRTVDLNRVCMQ